MPKSQWVRNVTDDTFTAEVVERSREVPVVVDFWAPWCGPCRALVPLIEQIVEEQNGAVILAKVNTDENPGLAQQFASEGIPAVYAVRDGAIVNQFLGMLPEEEVRSFVTSLLPTTDDLQLKQAQALETSNPAAAEQTYRSLLAANTASEPARVGLARVLLLSDGREAEAEQWLKPIEVGPHAEEAERLRAILELRQVPHSQAELEQARTNAASNATEGNVRLGAILAARGDYEPALQALLAAAEEDKTLARTQVRELMVRIFRVVGSPLADDYRRKLQLLLY